MTATPAGRGLGAWVWLPVLAFALLWVAIFATPGADCDGIEDDTSVAAVVLLGVAGVASLLALGAAAVRVETLRRGGRITRNQILWALAAVSVLFVASTLVDLGGSVEQLWRLWAVAIPATALALLALIVAWLRRLGPDEVGLLLPFYLVGAAVFVYPGFALLALALKSRALC